MALVQAENSKTQKRLQVAIVSSVLPRQCGIAKFSADISQSLGQLLGREAVSYVALNNSENYAYPRQVIFQIEQDRLEDYPAAAHYLNRSAIDLVSLQHEYGLFGGPEGSHITHFLSRLEKPVVTTMHTVLEKPSPGQYKSLVEVAAFSKAIVVMNRLAIKILTEIYDLPPQKIHLIPHGVANTFYLDPAYYKHKLALTNRLVLLTFGLLSRNKGVETVLSALRQVVDKHPHLLYFIVGVTHPVVKKRQGEEYRESLLAVVKELCLENNVCFINEFVDDETLNSYLGAADIVICPYHDEGQITSGVLSQALGRGKAIISTPYLHAREALSGGKGRLVNFRDAAGMSKAICELIEKPEERLAMAGEAFITGKEMSWEKVSLQYAGIFEAVNEKTKAASNSQAKLFTLPEIKMNYLKDLTDDTGIVQHTRYGIPIYSQNYSSDDAARALVAFVHYYNLFHDHSVPALIDRYMAFIVYCRREDGWFQNYMNYRKELPPQKISEDTFGRCLWGLGAVTRLAQSRIPGLLAATMVEESTAMLNELTYTRAQAYAACGLDSYLLFQPACQPVRNGLKLLADRLTDRYHHHSDGRWNWFEDFLSYDNARLPQALLLAYRHLPEPEYLRCGLESLDFLIREQYQNGYFDLIGNQGWYFKGNKRALYCQQPLDAGSLTEACVLAASLTGNEKYLQMAFAAFQWFLGRNRQGKSLYDPNSGACADGLTAEGSSKNMGAEATISFVLALISLYQWELVGRFDCEEKNDKKTG